MTVKVTELLYIDDFDQFVEVGRSMHDACEPEIPFDELHTRANLFACVGDVSREQFNAWIAKDGDKIVGFGAGTIFKYLFSSAPIAGMNLWYVLPEYRHTRASHDILHAFFQWAVLQGAARMELGVAKCNADEAEKLNRIFKKRGFATYGELFYKSI